MVTGRAGRLPTGIIQDIFTPGTVMNLYFSCLRQTIRISRLRAGVGVFGALLFLSHQTVDAGHDDLHIHEVMAGANGDSRVQFIVIDQPAAGEKAWGPQLGETQSRAMLVFFDALGRETGKFKFPISPPSGGTGKTLIATREFAALPGAPVPDIVIPPLLETLSGKVCFRNNPLNSAAPDINECVSYGGFEGDTEINQSGNSPGVAAGPPAPPLPIMNAVSLRRVSGTGQNSDFVLSSTPSPINSAGASFVIAATPKVVQGETLFSNETFSGNGRTCATCHVAGEGYGLTPENIQARFATLSAAIPSFDPLFIAESAPSSFDAGFDFNLNTLTLAAEVATPAPCPGELRGLITTRSGVRAKILARTGPTTYLVYGGLNPALTGDITDGVCSAAVAGMSSGDLAASRPGAGGGIEDPRYMRDSSDPNFPRGRGLIMEHIDGFQNPPVFRKSPHLINLSMTAPYGLSGEFAGLRDFTIGAVKQHFPRTLARSSGGANPDFRLPTDDELSALEAFMLSLEFPAGNDPNKFDLARFATTELQKQGRNDFFLFGCADCHGGPALSQMTTSILASPPGVNGAFNTGVTDRPFGRSLPCEPPARSAGSCGSREFSTPQLFNLPSLGPFFHDGSARTLQEAVDFYFSGEFGTSPVNLDFINRGIGIMPTDAMTEFLAGLVERPYTLSEGPVRFGARNPDSGRAPAQTITIRNSGPSALEFDHEACRLTGTDPGDFVIETCPLSRALDPGEARSIAVAFSPTGPGLKYAILEVHPIGSAPSGVDVFGVGGPDFPPQK
jgi:hypothetical protein